MIRAVVWSCVLACAGVAAAQPSNVSPQTATTAAKLFETGRDLAKAGNYKEACSKFEESYALDDGVGTELNLADCHEHLGHLAQAWRMFDDAAQRSTDNAARQKFASDRATGLAGKLATVVVHIAVPLDGVTISIAGRSVPARGEISEKVEPGPVAVHVSSGTTALLDAAKPAVAGATIEFDVTAPAPTSAPIYEPPSPRRHKRLVLAYGVAGSGLGVLGLGIVVGLIGKSHYNDAIDPANGCVTTGGQLVCPDGQRQKAIDAGNLADVGTIIGAVGLAAIATGVVLYATAPKDLIVTPMATNQTAGLAISGRF